MSKMTVRCRARSSWTRATSVASAKAKEAVVLRVKTPVFGILKRGGRVCTKMIPNAQMATLLPIIQAKVELDSVVYTDAFGSYDILDVSGFHHHRINHSKAFSSGPGRHINGIENFWNQSKRVLRKYNGIPRKHFFLFLKECEFRFNYGTPRQQLATLRTWLDL